MDDPRAVAGRYWLLQLVRLFCVSAAVYGAAIIARAVDGDQTVAGILFITGTAGFFFLPLLLVRRWRRDRP